MILHRKTSSKVCPMERLTAQPSPVARGLSEVLLESPVLPDTGVESRSLSEILQPWSVILHNDDHNGMDYVVAALVKSVPSLKVPDAIHIMLEAHNEGQAVVITCPLEPAELYRDRLRSFGLGATIERA